jgi:hypothetical protein
MSVVEETNSSKDAEKDISGRESFELDIIGSDKKKDHPITDGHPSWLAGWNTFCTSTWITEVDSPQTMVEQATKILAF